MRTKEKISVTIDYRLHYQYVKICERLLLNASAVVEKVLGDFINDIYKKYPELKEILQPEVEELEKQKLEESRLIKEKMIAEYYANLKK